MVDCELMRCRAIPTEPCEGDGIFACYNESCAKRDECWSSVMIDEDFSLTCQRQAHYPEVLHEVKMEDIHENTQVTIAWPSKEYANE